MAWSSKVKWTADEWKAYRRSKGIPPKADMPTILPPHIAKAGKELCAMMAVPLLDWDKKLFADAKLGGPPPSNKPTVDNICAFGPCKNEHKNRVSATKSMNNVHRVFWFCCGDHQRKWYSGGTKI